MTPFIGCDEAGMPLDPPRAVRRALIAEEMARIRRASEEYLPHDDRRQIVDLSEPVEVGLVRRSEDGVVLRAWEISDASRRRACTVVAIWCVAAAVTCAVIAGMCASSALDLAVLPLAVLTAGFASAPLLMRLVGEL